MHRLWYHSKTGKEHQWCCYQHVKDTWTKKTHFVDSEQTPEVCDILHHQDFLSYHENFQFFHFDIFFYKKEWLTIWEIEKWVKDKQAIIAQRRGVQPDMYLWHYFHSIYIDWVKKSYLLWEKWDMFCRLAFLYFSPAGQALSHTVASACRTKWLCHWYPYDYFTLRALRQSIKKENFALLTIQEHDVSVSIIKNGYYNNHATLNLWTNTLKDIYNDNSVAHLFYTKSSELNQTSEVIVRQSVKFFVTMLVQWLQEHISQEVDVIMVSSLTHNDIFVQEFDAMFQLSNGRFMLPFTHSEHLSPCGRDWLAQEMHVLSAVNMNKHWKKYWATLEWSLW